LGARLISPVIIIAIGLAFIALIAGAVYAVAFLVVQGISAISMMVSKIGEAIVDGLGRRHLHRRAIVPEELKRASDPLPKGDPDRLALLKYIPKPDILATPKSLEFKGLVSVMLANSLDSSANKVQVEELPQILSLSGTLPYERLFSILRMDAAYPVAQPARPKDIAPPPRWTPWRPTFPTPSFEPPTMTVGPAALTVL
jgi:hypothetical protein